MSLDACVRFSSSSSFAVSQFVRRSPLIALERVPTSHLVIRKAEMKTKATMIMTMGMCTCVCVCMCVYMDVDDDGDAVDRNDDTRTTLQNSQLSCLPICFSAALSLSLSASLSASCA